MLYTRGHYDPVENRSVHVNMVRLKGYFDKDIIYLEKLKFLDRLEIVLIVSE